MKKAIFLLAFGLFVWAEGMACSCIFFPFCQYVQHPPVKVAVQAKVIGSKVYAPDNFAVYLQVLEKYKDDVTVTDTIKVYGNDSESFCYVNVLTHFPVGDTVIVAFGIFQGFLPPIVNPDDAVENYYEVKPILCEMVKLNVENGIVSGPISPGISTYPLSHFENALGTCDFSVVDVEESAGPDPDFLIYPNPASGGNAYITLKGSGDPIEKVRVFSADGRLLGEYAGATENFHKSFEIRGLQAGLNLLEIHRSSKMYYRKAFVP